MKGPGVTPERLALAAEAKNLREHGWKYREIAVWLGISRSYASELCYDPDGAAAWLRKNSYRQPCVDCGASTSGSDGRRSAPLCHPCSSRRTGLANRKWPEEVLIARIQEWARLYGEPPAMPDWNPTKARQMGDEARALRFERADGHWPWFTMVVNRFGSWNAGIAAAKFQPRSPHGGDGNQFRQRSFRD